MSNLKNPVTALRNRSVLIAASVITASLFDVGSTAAESIRLGVLNAIGTGQLGLIGAIGAARPCGAR